MDTAKPFVRPSTESEKIVMASVPGSLKNSVSDNLTSSASLLRKRVSKTMTARALQTRELREEVTLVWPLDRRGEKRSLNSILEPSSRPSAG